MTDQELLKVRIQQEIANKVSTKMLEELVHNKLITVQLKTLCHSIETISHYCHSRQSCVKCLIKNWCKEQRKKCPEEWRSKICQEIDTQVVDQDKKN